MLIKIILEIRINSLGDHLLRLIPASRFLFHPQVIIIICSWSSVDDHLQLIIVWWSFGADHLLIICWSSGADHDQIRVLIILCWSSPKYCCWSFAPRENSLPRLTLGLVLVSFLATPIMCLQVFFFFLWYQIPTIIKKLDWPGLFLLRWRCCSCFLLRAKDFPLTGLSKSNSSSLRYTVPIIISTCRSLLA